MSGRRTAAIIIETVSVALLTGALNLLTPEHPGFAQFYLIPYIFPGLLFAAMYGVWPGILSLGASALVITVAFPFIRPLIFEQFSTQGYWSTLAEKAAVPLPLGLLSVYIFGFIRSTTQNTVRKLRERLAELSKANWLLTKKSDSLFTVNLEFEERVSKQRDSITSLYTQFQKLNILDLNAALNVLLETVQLFTGATRLSVWKYDDERDELLLEADRGFDDVDIGSTSIPLDNTIEGWVFRNSRFFSVRMVLEYDNLKKMDRGRNLITFPLVLQRRSWGVVNICEMPFEKYNLYTERLLHIIVSLAEHSLEEAQFYESIVKRDEIDETSGLPLFSQFYRMLERETHRNDVRKGDFSVIILELLNYPDIIKTHHSSGGKRLLRMIGEAVTATAETKPNIFHYKDDSQLAILFPNLDSDGVSLFCLELLEQISAGRWELDGTAVAIEAVIGFSVFSGNETPDSILEAAETLLDMQKI